MPKMGDDVDIAFEIKTNKIKSATKPNAPNATVVLSSLIHSKPVTAIAIAITPRSPTFPYEQNFQSHHHSPLTHPPTINAATPAPSAAKTANVHPIVTHPAPCIRKPPQIGPTSIPPANAVLKRPYAVAYTPLREARRVRSAERARLEEEVV